MSSVSSALKEILAGESNFRRKQIERAWFDVNVDSYDQITTLPLELREKLKSTPWLSLELRTMLTSKEDNTRKILFKLWDGNFIETVVMGRKNLKEDATEDDADRYTICISSQAGCPMRCAFCATGRGGFKRNLSMEEIVDQIRFSERLLAQENARVNNIVIMGQGEPLLNYENVKKALNVILSNTEIGETKITVSTAGVIPAMEQLLTDKEFPPVRWAISLHSAVEESRKIIMPSHKKGFLDFLIRWTNDYSKAFPSRTHFIGFEYIMLHGINDDEKHLKALIAFCKKIPRFRVNLIPYNYTGDQPVDNINYFERTPSETVELWHKALMNAGFTSTIRYSQGQDIMAACGQLSNKTSPGRS
jgi:23S rRNA (adenine2503-C2)-methyltransferase